MSFFRRPTSPQKPIIRDLRPHKWLLLIIGPVFSLVVAGLTSLSAEERIALFMVQAIAILKIISYLPDETQVGESPSLSGEEAKPAPSRFAEDSPFRRRLEEQAKKSGSDSDSPFRRPSPFGRGSSLFEQKSDDTDERKSPFTRSRFGGESPFRRKADDTDDTDEPKNPFTRSRFGRPLDETGDTDEPKNPFTRPRFGGESPFRRKADDTDDTDEPKNPFTRPRFGGESPFRRRLDENEEKNHSETDQPKPPSRRGKKPSDETEDQPTLFRRKSADESPGSTDDMGSVFKRYFEDQTDDDEEKNDDIPF